MSAKATGNFLITATQLTGLNAKPAKGQVYK